MMDNSSLSHTWPMPSLSRRSERRRNKNILRKVLIQRSCEYRQCTTQELSFQWHQRSPGQRFVEGVEEIAHFSTAHTWSSTRLFRWEGSRQHDRTPTKIASALANFPTTVIIPSNWPDWSKFQFLRSWHDPAEIRTTRTTTYQTWSERKFITTHKSSWHRFSERYWLVLPRWDFPTWRDYVSQ